MAIDAIDQDPDAATITVRAHYRVPPERLWRIWADPRQLERWWGPPTYPAEVLEHDLVPGGSVTYAMTGPEGDRHRGWWRVLEVDAPHTLVVEDGFADEDGAPVAGLPVTTMRVVIAAGDDGASTMTMTSTFASPEAMQQVLDMGVIEGLRAAMAQIDGILAMPAG